MAIELRDRPEQPGPMARDEAAKADVHQQLLALPRPDGTSDAPSVADWR